MTPHDFNAGSGGWNDPSSQAYFQRYYGSPEGRVGPDGALPPPTQTMMGANSNMLVELETPDGRRFEVDAPSLEAAVQSASQFGGSNQTNLSLEQRKALALAGARLRVQKQGLDSDQMIRVRAPDGTLVQFPPGTSLEVMKDAMRRKYGGPKGGPWEEYQGTSADGPWTQFQGAGKAALPADQPFPDPNIGHKGDMRAGDRVQSDLTNEAARYATFDLGDEVVAGMMAPIKAGVSRLGLSEAYQQVRAQQNAQQAATWEQHPYLAPAASLAGGLSTAPAMAGRALQGGNLFTKSAKGALAGGAMGGATGFGAGGEGWDDRIEGAKEGAKVGAITGAALPGAAAGLGQTYRGIRTVTRAATAPLRSLANKETFAAQKVAEALKRDQLTPQRLANRLATNQAYKSDLVAADVAGKNTQSLLRAANNVPSEARDKLTRALFQRQEKQLDRLRGDIGAAYGSPEDFHKTVDQLTAGRKQAAKPLFDAAFRTPTPYTRELEGVLSRPLTKALWERAATAAANRPQSG